MAGNLVQFILHGVGGYDLDISTYFRGSVLAGRDPMPWMRLEKQLQMIEQLLVLRHLISSSTTVKRNGNLTPPGYSLPRPIAGPKYLMPPCSEVPGRIRHRGVA